MSEVQGGDKQSYSIEGPVEVQFQKNAIASQELPSSIASIFKHIGNILEDRYPVKKPDSFAMPKPFGPNNQAKEMVHTVKVLKVPAVLTDRWTIFICQPHTALTKRPPSQPTRELGLHSSRTMARCPHKIRVV